MSLNIRYKFKFYPMEIAYSKFETRPKVYHHHGNDVIIPANLFSDRVYKDLNCIIEFRKFSV